MSAWSLGLTHYDYDTPLNFYSLSAESSHRLRATRQRQCFYAIAGTAGFGPRVLKMPATMLLRYRWRASRGTLDTDINITRRRSSGRVSWRTTVMQLD